MTKSLEKLLLIAITAVSLVVPIHVFAGQGSGGGGGGGGGGGNTPPPLPGPKVTVSREAQLIEPGAKELNVPSQSSHALNGDTVAFKTVGYGLPPIPGPIPGLGAVTPRHLLVYHRIGNIWNRQALLIPSDPSDHLNYANQIALDGDTLVALSGRCANPAGPYVYKRVQGVWIEEPRLVRKEALGDPSCFGVSIAVSGGTILVGAVDDNLSATPKPSVVYAFQRNALGKWTQTAKIVPSALDSPELFGRAISFNGDAFVVLGPPGSVSVYRRTLNLWKFEAQLRTTDFGSGLGSVLAISGDTVLVGGSWDIFNRGKTMFGSAYIFQRSAGVWVQQAKLTPSQRANVDNFGQQVSLGGNFAMMGYQGNAASGRVSLFTRVGTRWTETLINSPGVPVERIDKDDKFGVSALVSGNSAQILQPMGFGNEFVYRLTVTP